MWDNGVFKYVFRPNRGRVETMKKEKEISKSEKSAVAWSAAMMLLSTNKKQLKKHSSQKAGARTNKYVGEKKENADEDDSGTTAEKINKSDGNPTTPQWILLSQSSKWLSRWWTLHWHRKYVRGKLHLQRRCKSGSSKAPDVDLPLMTDDGMVVLFSRDRSIDDDGVWTHFDESADWKSSEKSQECKYLLLPHHHLCWHETSTVNSHPLLWAGL